MNPKQLRNTVIKPALEKLGLYSKEAEDLLLGTACVESRCGEYLQQINGPACGIFQMEPATAEDIFRNYLVYHQYLLEKIRAMMIAEFDLAQNLSCNLFFAAAMCRIHYLRQPEKIPADIDGQAEYWKKYYNTSKGKGTIEKYLQAYRGEV